MKQEWYKTWWGVVLCVLFFYITIPYLVWKKTNWNKGVKIGVTVACVLLFCYGIISSNLSKKKAEEDAILEKKRIENVLKEIDVNLKNGNTDKVQELLKTVDVQEVKELKTEFILFNRADYLYELGSLTDEDYQKLKNGILERNLFKTDALNKKYIENLKKIENKREEAIKKYTEIKVSALTKEAKKTMEKVLKKTYLKDPASYKEIGTSVGETGDNKTITIIQEFSAKNSFNGTVREICSITQDIRTGELGKLSCSLR